MLSTVVETVSGAKTFPTAPLTYSNLMAVVSSAWRAEVSSVAGIKGSSGQIPLYSWSSGSSSFHIRVRFNSISIHVKGKMTAACAGF